MAVYSGDNGYYKGVSYVNAPNNGFFCDMLETPLLSSADANPIFISPDVTAYPNVSYEITYPTGTTGTLVILGNNSGDVSGGEQISSAALSGTKALAKLANFGYRFLIIKITTLSGSISDILVVAKR